MVRSKQKNKFNIFKKGNFASLFNSTKQLVFQFGSAKDRNGVVIQRDGRLNGFGSAGGNNTDIALDILRDPAAQAAFDRLLEVMAAFKPVIDPGGNNPEDIAAADHIRETYIKRDSIMQAARETGALSKITGCSAHENNYARVDGKIQVKSLTPVDTDRIIYSINENSSDYVLSIETINKPFDGETPSTNKIVDFKYFSVYVNNPYGFGVGSQLIDVVDYKQRMVELWVRIAERYSTPVKIAEIPDTAEDEEVDDFFMHFKEMSEGSTFVLPPGFSLKVEDISSTGADKLLMKLIDYADQQIYALILGEYLTGREISNGAQARDAIATEITNRKALSLLNSIAARLNETTFTWLTQFNFPGAKPPILRYQQERNLEALSQRLSTLKTVSGKDFDKDWLEEVFDVKFSQEEPKGFGNKPIEFSESSAIIEDEITEN